MPEAPETVKAEPTYIIKAFKAYPPYKMGEHFGTDKENAELWAEKGMGQLVRIVRNTRVYDDEDEQTYHIETEVLWDKDKHGAAPKERKFRDPLEGAEEPGAPPKSKPQSKKRRRSKALSASGGSAS